MIVPRLIERKRNKDRLTESEWHELIQAYARDEVPDYQMSSLLMAIYFNGLDRAETNALTDAMIQSGGQLDLSHLNVPRIDKHSTGGVGDKVSLILAPLIASLGVAVPMMSGRGLGHTGGTLDKLESIPGMRTDIALAEAVAQLKRIGCVMMGQSAEVVPADRGIYALRNATATAESVPLVASSIMSKKLAEDLTGLVLDVKRGSGSLVQSLDQALELAGTMVALGDANGCEAVALLTAMDRPLGRAVGNALEVEEAIHALTGEGPPDLMTVTYALGAEMLQLGGVAADADEARRRMEVAISSGQAARKLQEIIEAQGGNPGVVDDPAVLPQAGACELFEAPRRGFVARVEPRGIGRALVALGGGRAGPDDRVDPGVGFVVTAKPGDWVELGEPVATIFARDDAGIATGRSALRSSIVIGDEADHPLPLVSHRVTMDGVTRAD